MGLPSQKKSYAVAVVMRGESVIEVASLQVPFISFAPGFLMSIEPLNHAPSSIEILWQTTSPAKRPFVPYVNPVAGRDVAFYLAQDDNFLSVNVGLDLAVAANRNAVAGQIDGAFYAAVDV